MLTNMRKEITVLNKELNTIVSALRLGGDVALYQKMIRVQEVRAKILKQRKSNLDLYCNGFSKRYCQRDWR